MDAFQRLLAYDWPGNIRQLRNVIRTALAICDGGVVRLRDLPSEVRDGSSRVAGVTVAVAAPSDASPATDYALDERDSLLKAISDHRGNMSHVAKALGISRTTLYRRCHQLGVTVHRINGVVAGRSG
jgi:transcriptional regulator of acetoin/glycerol metabolism